MISFITHNYLVFKRREVWLHENENIQESAYTVYSASQIPPINRARLHCEAYDAIYVDLSRSEEELANAMHPRLRQDIRNAEKKNMEFITISNPTEKDTLEAMISFNAFIQDKPIAPLTKRWMLAAQRSGNLLINKIRYSNEDVVTHIFLSDKKTALNTQSFHNANFNNPEISKFANKLLHWKEILLYKELGFSQYSFGPVNKNLKGITQFKTWYGGSIMQNYRIIKLHSLLYFPARFYNTLKVKLKF